MCFCLKEGRCCISVELVVFITSELWLCTVMGERAKGPMGREESSLLLFHPWGGGGGLLSEVFLN